MSPDDNPHTLLGRIRFLNKCIECFRKSEPLPESLCYVPKEVCYKICKDSSSGSASASSSTAGNSGAKSEVSVWESPHQAPHKKLCKCNISTFILWKLFWNRTLRYHRNGTLKYFSGLLPFSGRCHIPNVLRSYRITTFYNLDKIHIIGKVWDSGFHIWWSFCDKSKSGREIDTFVTEKCIKKIQWGLNGTRWLFVV